MKFVINANASITFERTRSVAPFVRIGKRHVYLSSLETAWRELLRHRMIGAGDAMKCLKAQSVAAEFAAGLVVPIDAPPVAFAGGRFEVHRDGLGNATLLNPQRDVLTIQQDRWRGGHRIIVGYYASVRQAVWSAVQQAAYASPVEQAYSALDEFMHQLARDIAGEPMPPRANRKRKAVLT